MKAKLFSIFSVKSQGLNYGKLVQKMSLPQSLISSKSSVSSNIPLHKEQFNNKKIFDSEQTNNKKFTQPKSRPTSRWKSISTALLVGFGIFSLLSANIVATETEENEEEKKFVFSDWLEDELSALKTIAPDGAPTISILDLRKLKEENYNLTRNDLEILENQLTGHLEVLRIIWPEKMANETFIKEKIAKIEALLIQHRKDFLDRPSDYTYAFYSQEVYQKNGGIPLSDEWEVLAVSNRLCDLVSILSPPTKEVIDEIETYTYSNLDGIGTYSNAAYVRNGDKLFYINKIKKECIEIKLDKSRLEEFDNKMQFDDKKIQSLSENQLQLITSITGHTVIDHSLNTDGYFGAAYINKKTRHIIIAHRGTENEINDWIEGNIPSVIQGKVSLQLKSANKFSKDIKNRTQENRTQEDYHGYHISFAGHSLGGFLAQMTTYEFKNQGYETHAVVMESPGSSGLLQNFQQNTEQKQNNPIEKLNITNYLSVPNLVNACNAHFEVTYRLFPQFESLSNTLLSITMQTHPIAKLLPLFDPQTGIPRDFKKVVDWPKLHFRSWENAVDPFLRCAWWGVGIGLGRGFIQRRFSSTDQSIFTHQDFYPTISNKNELKGDALLTAILTGGCFLYYLPSIYFSTNEELSGYHNISKNDRYDPESRALTYDQEFDLIYKLHYQVINPKKDSHIDLRLFSIKVRDFLENYLIQIHKLDTTEELLEALNIPGLTVNDIAILRFLSIDKNQLVLSKNINMTPMQVRNHLTCLLKMYYQLSHINAELEDYRFKKIIKKQQPLQVSQNEFLFELPERSKKMEQFLKDEYLAIKNIKQASMRTNVDLFINITPQEIEEARDKKELLKEQWQFGELLQKEIKEKINRDTIGEKVTKELDILDNAIHQQDSLMKIVYPFQEAVWYHKQGQYAQARSCLEQAENAVKTSGAFVKSQQIDINDLQTGIYSLRAEIAHSEGIYEEAVSYYKQALDIDPKNAFIRSSLGVAYDDWDFHSSRSDKEKSFYAEAIPYLQEALNQDPKNPYILRNLGKGLYLLAKAKQAKNESVEQLLVEAKIHLSEAIKHDQKSSTAFLFRGMTRMMQAEIKQSGKKHKLQGAQEDFDRALALQKDNPIILQYQAKLLEQLEKNKKALEKYEQAYRKAKAHPKSRNERAQFKKLKEMKEKREEMEKVVFNPPSSRH